MERMMASLSARLASWGKCSEKGMRATLVAISLNGPPLAWPGLRSQVSIWLGPPFIHSRMQARLRWGSLALSWANRPSQPDIEMPAALAAARRSQSRLENSRMGDSLLIRRFHRSHDLIA